MAKITKRDSGEQDFYLLQQELDLDKQKRILEDATEEIVDSISSVTSSFLTIGEQLNRVKETKAYEYMNYYDIYEYAEKTFGFKATSTKNFINVYLKFSNKEKALEYNFSQLVELIPVAEDENVFEQLPSDLNRDEMREIKKVIYRSGVAEAQEVDHKENAEKMIIGFLKPLVLNKPSFKIYFFDDVYADFLILQFLAERFEFRIRFDDLSFYPFYSRSDFNLKSWYKEGIQCDTLGALMVAMRKRLNEMIEELESLESTIANDVTKESLIEQQEREKEELKELNKTDPLLFKNKEHRIAFGTDPRNYETVISFEITGVTFTFFKLLFTEKDIVVEVQSINDKVDSKIICKTGESNFSYFGSYEFDYLFKDLRVSDLDKFPGKTLDDFNPEIYMEKNINDLPNS